MSFGHFLEEACHVVEVLLVVNHRPFLLAELERLRAMDLPILELFKVHCSVLVDEPRWFQLFPVDSRHLTVDLDAPAFESLVVLELRDHHVNLLKSQLSSNQLVRLNGLHLLSVGREVFGKTCLVAALSREVDALDFITFSLINKEQRLLVIKLNLVHFPEILLHVGTSKRLLARNLWVGFVVEC